MPTILDAIQWLQKDKHRLFLFLEIATARIIKKEVNRWVQQLLDQDLIRNDRRGLCLTERGKMTIEAIQALGFLDEIP